MAASTQAVSGAVLLEHETELVGRTAGVGGELADDCAVLDLHAGHEQCRREVEDGSVDLVGLERGLGAHVVVVDERLLRGLDHVGDERQAGGADLGAELDVLEVGNRGGPFGRRALERHDRLVGGEVRQREVDVLGTLRGDRVLLEIHVEALRSGLDRLVERGAGPHDGIALVAHLGSDGVGNGGLESFAGLRGVVEYPWEEGRFAGGDGEDTVFDRGTAVGVAGRRRWCRSCQQAQSCRLRRRLVSSSLPQAARTRAPTAMAGMIRRRAGERRMRFSFRLVFTHARNYWLA